MFRNIAIIAALLLISGCAKNINPDTYSVGSVGQPNRTVRGTVQNVREVHIEGNRSGLGAGAGALAGGVGGSALGGGARANIIGAVGGAVVGGIAGAAVEEGVSQQNGLEYVVETSNGLLVTVVQGQTPRLNAGDEVLLIYGNPTRVIPAVHY